MNSCGESIINQCILDLLVGRDERITFTGRILINSVILAMGVEQTTQNHTPGSAGGADVDAIGFFLDENLRPGRFAVYESDLEAKKMMMMMMEKLGAEECESAE